MAVTIALILLMVFIGTLNFYTARVMQKRTEWEKEHLNGADNVAHVFIWSEKDWNEIRAYLENQLLKGTETRYMTHTSGGKKFVFKVVKNYTAPKKRKKSKV